MSKTQKGNKEFQLPPVRMDSETYEQLNNLAQVSKKKKSEVVRELIRNGTVTTIYNAKEISKNLAGVHNDINQYSLIVHNELSQITSELYRIRELLCKNNIASQNWMTNLLLIENCAKHLVNRFDAKCDSCRQKLQLPGGGQHGNL